MLTPVARSASTNWRLKPWLSELQAPLPALDFAQSTGNGEAADHGDREGGRIGPLAPNLRKAAKPFVQRSCVLDQDRPPNDMIKIGGLTPRASMIILESYI
jgi:hypothetical protein